MVLSGRLVFVVEIVHYNSEVSAVKYWVILLILIAPVFVGLLSGCGGGGGGGSAAVSSPDPPIVSLDQAKQRSTWTVLVYLDADNNLESAGIRNFNQMEKIGSTQNVHVIVQMDRKSGLNANNERWTDTRRYLVIRDSDEEVMHSIRLDDDPLGELNMGDWQTLKDFVEWGTHEFPADHYCLVIWDHGTGWNFRTLDVEPKYKYIAVDDTDSHSMNVTEIPLALANVGIDVIAFDACYMQQLEIAYELRNSARYLVASTTTEPSPGYNYARWLGRTNNTTSPEQLCKTIVSQYANEYPAPRNGITQSAVDLGMMDQLADAVDGFAQVLNANSANYSSGLKIARNTSLNYSTSVGDTQRYCLDIMDYSKQCASALGLNAEAAYAELADALDSAIIAEMHNPDMSKAYGLSVYVPPPGRYDVQYGQLAIAANTYWNEWLIAQAE